MSTRREKKFRKQEYYESAVNSWVNVFKGVLLALVVHSTGEKIYEFIISNWTNI